MYVKERFKLADTTVSELRNMTPDFGYGAFGEFVFYRTYSRSKPDGSKENWCDVVIRVVEGVFSIRKDWYVKTGIEWDESFWQHYALHFAKSMHRMEWMPPGRGLWAMGTDYIYNRGSMALQNCGFVKLTKNIGNDLAWMADCLMCGVGVGFSPERDDEFDVYSPRDSYEFIIPDSREGWVDSILRHIDSRIYENIPKPVHNYSLIRESGQLIKGFGGVSSGPGPLKQLHTQIDEFFDRYLHDLDYDSVRLKTDLANAIGVCVVSGNVRRSAQIALGDIDDETFLNLKDYNINPDRANIGYLSNNSVFLEKDSDFEKLGEIAKRVLSNGEPGFVQKLNLKKGRIGKEDRLKDDPAIGINPCLKKSAKLLTPVGIRDLSTLNIGDIIWSESGWTKITNKWSTGFNKVYRYKTNAGFFESTDNHRVVSNGLKIEVKNALSLMPLRGKCKEILQVDKQSIIDGLVIGDGTTYRSEIILCISVKENKDYFNNEISEYIGDPVWAHNKYRIATTIDSLPYRYNRKIPTKYLESEDSCKCSFLRGLYSANGSVSNSAISLKATSFDVIKDVQLMLNSLGIVSTFYITTAHVENFENRTWNAKTSYNLNISNRYGCSLFLEKIGFIQKYKTEKLSLILEKIDTSRYKTEYDIFNSEEIGIEETFDITVDNASHTFWCNGFNISNCGEQPLCDKETCTLVETLPTRCESNEQWLKACEYAAVYASTVTLLPTHNHETNKIMVKNRRIGVGIIDVSGWRYSVGTNQLIKWLRAGYDRVISTNRWLNSEAGIAESIRHTTIKPSGTVAKVAGRTSGAGWPTFHHTLMRVRVARNSGVCPLLMEAGVPWEPEINQPDTTLVFEFPVLQGPAKPATEVSLWEQAMNLVLLQREWSNNAVSNTLYFKPQWELIEVVPEESDNGDEPFFRENEDEFYIGDVYYTKEQYKYTREHGLINIYQHNKHHEENDVESVLSAIAPLTKSASLLPHSAKGAYKQIPQQSISEEEYNRRVAAIKPIEWSKLRDFETVPEKYCEGDKCQVQ